MFAIINARSLAPKTASFVENFIERDWTFAILSKTWFTERQIYRETVEELRLGHGLELICQNRCGMSGGGVAIISRRSRIRLKSYPTKRNGCKILTAKGRMNDCTRPVFIIRAYLPLA